MATNSEISNLEWRVVEAAVLLRRVTVSYEAECLNTPVNTYPELGMNVEIRAALVEKDALRFAEGRRSASLEYNNAVDALIAARELKETEQSDYL